MTAAVGTAASAAEEHNSTATPVVVALGDSLTAGYGLQRTQAYPALLQAEAANAGFRHRVLNAGVSGETSSDIARRFDRDVPAGTRVLILAAGANDGLRGVPIPTLKANLSRIIEKAQQRGIEVLLCGMETPPYRGWEYTIEFHHVFPELAAKYHLNLMPFLLTGVVGLRDFNGPDGVHPNAKGSAVIATNMWPHLEPLLRQTN